VKERGARRGKVRAGDERGAGRRGCGRVTRSPATWLRRLG